MVLCCTAMMQETLHLLYYQASGKRSIEEAKPIYLLSNILFGKRKKMLQFGYV